MNSHTHTTDTLLMSRAVRRMISAESFAFFMHMYLDAHLTHTCGFVQRMIMQILQHEKRDIPLIPTFPGAGVTTIVTLGYTLWSILGNEQLHHVAVICKNRAEALRIQHLLYHELTGNKLLISDYRIRTKKIRTDGLHIRMKDWDAKISTGYIPQKLQKMRYKGQEPNVILIDDMNESPHVITWAQRELFRKRLSESRTILYGKRSANLVTDIYMWLLEHAHILQNHIAHTAFPLFDEHDRCLWKERYTRHEQKKILDRLKKDKALKDLYRICDREEIEVGGDIDMDKIPMYTAIPDIERIETRIRLEKAKKFPSVHITAEGFSYYGIGYRNIVKTVDEI